ncbi:MAG: NADH-quinone oxidoreductase subunit B [Dehalococcoidia bacterium]|nr:NADH-quinone oxidoreductase subunit B [Dehalococcoidia bacterium]
MEIESISSAEIEHRESDGIEVLRIASQHPIPDPDDWLDENIKRNVIFTTVDAALNWARKTSLWPVTAFTACCTFEFIGASSSRFDIARFGMEVLRASPRQADLLVCAGTLTWKMAPQIKRLYDQMAEPKWTIAMGACAISGGIFHDSYSVVPGYNHIVPIDVYIPGCPPRPETLLAGIEKLRRKIEKESISKPR